MAKIVRNLDRVLQWYGKIADALQIGRWLISIVIGFAAGGSLPALLPEWWARLHPAARASYFLAALVAGAAIVHLIAPLFGASAGSTSPDPATTSPAERRRQLAAFVGGHAGRARQLLRRHNTPQGEVDPGDLKILSRLWIHEVRHALAESIGGSIPLRLEGLQRDESDQNRSGAEVFTDGAAFLEELEKSLHGGGFTMNPRFREAAAPTEYFIDYVEHHRLHLVGWLCTLDVLTRPGITLDGIRHERRRLRKRLLILLYAFRLFDVPLPAGFKAVSQSGDARLGIVEHVGHMETTVRQCEGALQRFLAEESIDGGVAYEPSGVRLEVTIDPVQITGWTHGVRGAGTAFRLVARTGLPQPCRLRLVAEMDIEDATLMLCRSGRYVAETRWNSNCEGRFLFVDITEPSVRAGDTIEVILYTARRLEETPSVGIGV